MRVEELKFDNEAYMLLETDTNEPRKIKFGEPTHAAGVVRGQLCWEATLLFNPTNEFFNLTYRFSELPERAPPLQIAKTFALGFLEKRMPAVPSKQAALSELVITDIEAFLQRLKEARREDYAGKTIVGASINGQKSVVLFPEKCNLAQAQAFVSGDVNLANQLNAYTHGIVEGVRKVASERVLYYADTILAALSERPPISNNLQNSYFEELREALALAKHHADRSHNHDNETIERLGSASIAILKFIGLVVAEQQLSQLVGVLMPDLEHLSNWIAILLSLS